MLNLETTIVHAMATQFHAAACGPYGRIDPAAAAAAQALRAELEACHGRRIGSVYGDTKRCSVSDSPESWAMWQVREAIASGLDWGPHKLSGAAPLECSAE